MKQLYICLSVIIVSLTACGTNEENYLGNWDAAYIEINQVEPWLCSSSWAEIYKLDDGSMRVELRICDEEFFATSNNYNYDIVEFEFVDALSSDVDVVVEGTIQYVGSGEIELDMIRDVYVDGFFVSGKSYFAVFD